MTGIETVRELKLRPPASRVTSGRNTEIMDDERAIVIVNRVV
jgi:hypothetical protein